MFSDSPFSLPLAPAFPFIFCYCEFPWINLKLQVEPNAQKIEEHRRKYDRLRKERELRKMQRQRRRRRAEAQVNIENFFWD